jgi:protein-tyrosine phosphatase
MDWITDKIAIGNFLDSREATLLKRTGFRSVLCLDSTIPPVQLDGITRQVVHLVDEPCCEVKDFLQAVAALQNLVETSSPVFVHCYAGRSRSVIVVAAWFMRTTGCSAREAISKIESKRLISITPGIERLLEHL